MGETLVEQYLRLGLRLGRHVEGLVDSYSGPPEVAAAVAAEQPIEPAVLAEEADGLLAQLDDGWLADQVLGLRTCAAFIAGEPGSYADEVEGCFGVRPTRTDEAVFAAAHEELGGLLPGGGPLGDRYERWRKSIVVAPERIESTMAALIERRAR